MKSPISFSPGATWRTGEQAGAAFAVSSRPPRVTLVLLILPPLSPTAARAELPAAGTCVERVASLHVPHGATFCAPARGYLFPHVAPITGGARPFTARGRHS